MKSLTHKQSMSRTPVFTLDVRSHHPLWRQLVGQLERMIAAGSLPAGTRLPPVREVSARYGVNAMTVSKAYAHLAAVGTLVGGRGRAMRVSTSAHADGSRMNRARFLEGQARELVAAALELRLSADDVGRVIREAWLDSRSRHGPDGDGVR